MLNVNRGISSHKLGVGEACISSWSPPLWWDVWAVGGASSSRSIQLTSVCVEVVLICFRLVFSDWHVFITILLAGEAEHRLASLFSSLSSLLRTAFVGFSLESLEVSLPAMNSLAWLICDSSCRIRLFLISKASFWRLSSACCWAIVLLHVFSESFGTQTQDYPQ